MAANPDPTRISNASWWFSEQLLHIEPGTRYAGIFADKEGYHNTGDANLRRWPGSYSIQHVKDRRGPSWRTKAAAYDWTFPEAQRGDYRRMVKYGQRLWTAYLARDPRLAGWREALGQTDLDGPPEGLDFRHHYTRVPDDTHRWHWHFSEDREQVEDYRNKRAMLSVLRGQSLADWLRDEEDDVSAADVWAFRFKGVRDDKTPFDFSAQEMIVGANAAAWKAVTKVDALAAELIALKAEQAAWNAAEVARDTELRAAFEAGDDRFLTSEQFEVLQERVGSAAAAAGAQARDMILAQFAAQNAQHSAELRAALGVAESTDVPGV